MKKLLCILLALMMLLAMLAGCDSDSDRRRDDDDDDRGSAKGSLFGDKDKKDDDDDDSVASNGDSAVSDSDDDEEDSVVTSTEAATQPTEGQAETEAATQPSQEESDLTLGYLDGNTYVNTYAGFACTLDDAWTFYSADQLQNLPSQIASAGSGELAAYLEAYPQISVMMAENVTDLTTMNLLYQQTTAQQQVLYATLSEEEVIDMTLEQAGTLKEYYASLGITVYSMKKVEVYFLGEVHYALYSDMEVQGRPYYTLQLMNCNQGEYSITLTLASYMEDNTAKLLDLFVPAN